MKGNLVIIDITDEYASDTTYKSHLNALGLEHLIPSMFPSDEPPSKQEDIHKKLAELGLDKD